MLWKAGQERVTRERLERMTEMFVTTRDALQHALVPVVQMSVEKMPERPRPFYLPKSKPMAPADRLAAGRAQMARLQARYPRNMRGYN